MSLGLFDSVLFILMSWIWFKSVQIQSSRSIIPCVPANDICQLMSNTAAMTLDRASCTKSMWECMLYFPLSMLGMVQKLNLTNKL